VSTPKYNFALSSILIVLVVGLLTLAAQTPFAAHAGGGLPPRDPPTPLPAGDGGQPDKEGALTGAYLELVAPGAPAGAWAVVQWQDSAGGWHDVEGWRGAVADSSRWWVQPKDFGTGPFRWRVTTGPEGPLWAASASFNLPSQPNQTVQVVTSPNP
jgi:hypothetical protein